MTRRPQFDYNVPRLDNVIEADEFSKDFSENITESTRATYPPSANRRLVLPPLQVSRSLKPNENYYRKISVEHYKHGGGKTLSPIHQRMAVLADITGHHETDKHNNIKPQPSIGSPRQMSPSLRPIGFPITSIKQYSNDYKPSGESGADKYEWNYSKTVGPVKMSKHLNDSQKFWKPRESLKAQKSSRRVVLPKIG
uniref:Uncharacterized protein n=1 Tax=Ciona savignyi TaxID=51511 RepID=H2YFJ1_CIOSA